MSLIPSGFSKNAAGGEFYSQPINQSLRFNDDDSAYLSWTPSSAGNRKTWTWSGWVKRSNVDDACGLLCGFDNSTGGTDVGTTIRLLGNYLDIFDYTNGVYNFQLQTVQLFRDASAWYHIVVAFDTTQATAANRVKLYVNGEQVTTFSPATYPSQNTNWTINNTVTHGVGCIAVNNTPDQFHDGYLAEVNFIDGTALDATSFGETKSGVWIPKAYAGSYGTNGFYLDFGNSGSIGADVSGNSNNFTANNLAATDVVLDSPTNNFATLNPLDWDRTANQPTFYEGNLKISVNNGGAYSSIAIPNSGKWYFEMYAQSVNSSNNDAVALGATSGSDITSGYYWRAYRSTGVKDDGSSSTSYGGSWGTGDLIGTAWDADTGTLSFYKNGTSLGSAWTGLTPPEVNKFFVYPRSSVSTGVMVVNFGQDSSFAGNKTAQGNTDDNGYGDFYYAPPTGYLALCTANLTVPDAMNPALDNSPQDYFNTVLYTGNSSTNAITGVGFQPDFLWLKARSATGYDHVLQNVITGSTNQLYTNSTSAEVSDTDAITSFDTDGFTSGADITTNNSGVTYVAWNWKANGSGVSNTDGSITSTVSANTDAGFSIVSYTGTGSGTPSVGHGLNQKPDFWFIKDRDNATDWITYTQQIDGTLDFVRLNTTGAKQDSANPAPTDSVFYISGGDINNSGADCIAYCFHSVEGFSKIGSYTGNGSTDGPFVYTGFRPAYVLYKRTNEASNWWIQDGTRSPYNLVDDVIYADLSNAEETASAYVKMDLLSNGFKIQGNWAGHNGVGDTYIYMAFAENPFKYSTAR